MDHHHLDVMTRSLASFPSRRDLLRAFAGAGFGFVGWPSALHDVGARKKRKNKGRNRKGKHKKQPGQLSPPTSPQPPPLSPPPAPPPPPPPDPVARVDATCPGSSPVSATGIRTGRLAEAFTALANGTLVSAQLPIIKDPRSAGDYVLRLAPVDGAGVPTNGLLAETAVANATVSVGKSLVTFTFRAPASVEAGTGYALVLTRPGDDVLWWGMDIQSSCAGQAFFSQDETGPFYPDTLGDFIFTTYVSS